MIKYDNNKKLMSIGFNKVLIAAHRGCVGGNIIPNTKLSFKNALLHNADIVEMDLIRSSDGVFYAFHDGEEKKILNRDVDIRTYKSDEIDKLYTYNSLFLKTERHLEKAEEVLLSLKDKCFINIDRSWFYWKETIAFLDKLNMSSQIILKSPVELNLLKELESLKTDIMYMPIINNIDEWEIVKSKKINTVAAELVFDNLESPLCSKDFIENLKKNNVLLWVNSIMLDDSKILSGHLDDNVSILEGFDKGWGNLIAMGFNIIQTDWPLLLSTYLNKRNNYT